jgi:hypothetical protein
MIGWHHIVWRAEQISLEDESSHDSVAEIQRNLPWCWPVGGSSYNQTSKSEVADEHLGFGSMFVVEPEGPSKGLETEVSKRESRDDISQNMFRSVFWILPTSSALLAFSHHRTGIHIFLSCVAALIILSTKVVCTLSGF